MNDDYENSATARVLQCALHETGSAAADAGIQLTALPTAFVVEQLTTALRHEETGVRRRAARILGQCGESAEDAVAALCVTLRDDPGWTVREAAAASLGLIIVDGHTEASDELADRALRDRSRLVREAAVASLKRLIAVGANVPDGLHSAISDRRPSTRCRAVRALARLGNDETFTQVLANLMNDSHRKVRVAAIQSLRFYEDKMEEMVPTLVNRVFDGDRAVSLAAEEMLSKVEQRSAAWRPWLSIVLQRGSTAEDSLRKVLESSQLPSDVHDQFSELCGRRISWMRKTRSLSLSDANAEQTNAAELIESAVSLESPKKRAKESAWLLRQLFELLHRILFTA